MLAGLLAATGGCLGVREGTGPDAPTEDERPPDDTRSPTDGPRGGSCSGGFTVDLSAFDPATDLPVALHDAERELVDRAVADGPVTVETYDDSAPLPDGSFLERDGAYHRLDVAETAAEEVPARELDLEWEAGQTAPDDAAVLAFEDLPANDRNALEQAVFGSPYGPETGLPQEGLTMQDVPVPYPDDTADSALVGAGWTWLRWDDRTYRVRVGTQATVTRHSYEVAVPFVAEGAGPFREAVAERFLVDLSGVSGPERAILEAATTEDGHEECEPASDGLAALQERLADAPTLPHPADGEHYAAFDGERWALAVRNWVH